MVHITPVQSDSVQTSPIASSVVYSSALQSRPFRFHQQTASVCWLFWLQQLLSDSSVFHSNASWSPSFTGCDCFTSSPVSFSSWSFSVSFCSSSSTCSSTSFYFFFPHPSPPCPPPPLHPHPWCRTSQTNQIESMQILELPTHAKKTQKIKINIKLKKGNFQLNSLYI